MNYFYLLWHDVQKVSRRKQILRIMRISLFLLIFSTTFIFAESSYSQKARVTIKQRNVQMETVLNEIESQTDYLFLYNGNQIDMTKNVSVNVRNMPVNQLLTELFSASQVKYLMEGTHIVLIPDEYDTKETMGAVFRQQITITGTITDKNDETLPGVNIVVKGTTIGQISDVNGKYSINVPNREAILVFSFVGYATQELLVENNLTINVQMAEDASQIEEVVVVGYGVQKKENLTGSMTVVNMDKVLGDRPLTNVGTALQGAVPGLQITGGASPGASSTFNIRGSTVINRSSDYTPPGPLILIDNVEGQINLVNPEDIETITVLKDAASAAIYGARAAFGVILITTKKAKKNSKMTINYNNNFAFEKVTNQLDPASVRDVVSAYNEWMPGGSWIGEGQQYNLWLDYIDDYRKNPTAFESQAKQNGDYFDPRWGLYTPGTGVGANKFFYLKDNNAQNEIFDNFGFQQTHNISASGGSETIAYRLSMGYTDKNGPLKTSKDSYQRYTVAAYVSADVTKWMNQTLDIRYSQGSRQEMENDWGARIFDTKYFGFLPGADSWKLPSSSNETIFLNTSPLNYLLYCDPRYTRNENPHIFSKTTFTPFKGFEGVVEYSYNENVYDRKYYPLRPDMHGPQLPSLSLGEDTEFRRDKSTYRHRTFNVYGTYSLTLANMHNFKLMAGYSQEQRYYDDIWVIRTGAINTNLPSITGSEGEIRAGDSYTEYALQSGFFRFNYNYNGKYLLEVNGRYDGSSRFPKDYRFGFFPSVSAGWQIARESFMEWSSGWLNELKIRGSYGALGNQVIDNYQFLPDMEVIARSSWINDGKRPTTLKEPPMVRTNFTWERAETLDFGADIALLNHRLQATFDWYRRDTKGMLDQAEEYASVVGASAPTTNSADLRSKGFELSVNWRDHIGDWGYFVGFNLYDYRASVTRFNNEDKSLGTYYVGQNIGQIWGYQFERFYTVDDFEDVSSWKLKDGVTSLRGYSPKPGDIMFKNLMDDENSENEISPGSNTLENPGDRKIIGNNTLRYQFGINAGVSFKGFDLSVFMQGVGKRDEWLGGDMIFPLTGTNNTNENTGTMYKHQVGKYAQVRDAANGDYTLVNPDAYLPRVWGQPGILNESNKRTSDRYLQDASYLRVKNITLSYRFPAHLIQPIGLSNARVFVSAENVFTFSSLPKGVDPERISWGYPFYATYSFGINITL